MSSILTSYKIMTRDLPRTINRLSSEPQIAREVKNYREQIGKVKSIDDFLQNRDVYNFAMTAFGLKDMIYAKGLIKKVLTDGTDNPAAFSVRMADPRFRELAEAFNFKRYGTSTTAFDRTQQGTVERFLRSNLEERAGQENEALRLALHFERKAPELLSNFSILADRAMLTVVRTALGLPDSFSSQDLEKQAKQIGERVNVADFKDSKKRGAFIERFLTLHSVKNSNPLSDAGVSILSGRVGQLDQNTLLTLQTLRRV
jgi:poly-D-alanine transfer protein DltD